MAAANVNRRMLFTHSAAAGSGLAGRGVRFAISGGVVTLLYLAVTTLLSSVLGAPFQVALAIGFVTAVCTHFLLQRVFVWVHAEGFALPLHRQVGRYVVVAGIQYGLTAASTALLPGLLDVRTLYVYLVTAAIVTTINFLVFRRGVFHASRLEPE